jgi:hypothetical protein
VQGGARNIQNEEYVMRPSHSAILATLSVGATLSLTACSTAAHGADRTGGPDAGKPSGTSAGTSAAPRPCDLRQLDFVPGPGDIGAGQISQPIIVKNINISNSCRISGRITIQLRDAEGSRVGRAVRSAPSTVVLPPLGTATLTLRTANEGMGAECLPETQQIEITIPGTSGQTEGAFEARFKACGGFRVDALAKS